MRARDAQHVRDGHDAWHPQRFTGVIPVRAGIDHHESASPCVVFTDESQTGRGLIMALHDDVLEEVAQAGFHGTFVTPVDIEVVGHGALLSDLAVGLHEDHSGRVAEFIYLGDHVRVRMEVAGKTDFFVKQPIAELDPAMRVGDVVPIGWQTEHARALDPLQQVQ